MASAEKVSFMKLEQQMAGRFAFKPIKLMTEEWSNDSMAHKSVWRIAFFLFLSRNISASWKHFQSTVSNRRES